MKFIVLTRNDHFAAELRTLFLKLEDVRIVAEVEEPALVAQAVGQLPVDVLLVNLDPSPEAILPIVGDIAQAHRELAIVAVSESTDGTLILEAMRMGIKEFLPKPLDTKAITEAIDRLAVNRAEKTADGTFITVVGTSGGVGATLITTNLAVELAALAGGQVTVVDLDHRFGQVATLLDVEPKYTLADLCSSPEQLESQVIGRALAKHASGVRVLSRPANLPEADTITAAASMGVFANLIQLNEYVLADGPTRFDVGGKSILALSDVTLAIVQPLVPCIRNALRLFDSLREHGFNLDRIKLICNRMGPASGHLSVNDITETLGLKAFASLPDDWATASGAINLGEPLLTYSPKSKLRIAIQEIAQRLHNPDSQADDRNTCKQSLIGRIFASS